MKPITAFCYAAFAFSAAISSARAADFSLSFTGNLQNDEDIQFFNFTLNTVSDVTLRTFGYGGGTNAQGANINAGGFDPVLSLFTSSGSLVGFSDDDPTNTVSIDPATGQAFDALLRVMNLPTNTYTVAISQFGRTPILPGDTLVERFAPSGTTGFRDVLGNIRTSAFAFDIIVDEIGSGGPPVITPDNGSTLILVSLAFGGLVALRRKLRA